MELLALTACQTGIGDDRATLGMAGITVEAGVRSALASLWYVDDALTQELIAKFYDNLRSPKGRSATLSPMSKANTVQLRLEALFMIRKEGGWTG